MYSLEYAMKSGTSFLIWFCPSPLKHALGLAAASNPEKAQTHVDVLLLPVHLKAGWATLTPFH